MDALPSGVLERLAQLRALVSPRAQRAGPNPLGLPGAWIYRADRPEPMVKHSAALLRVGVIVQGRKQLHVDGRVLSYDESSCIVLTGEVDYSSCVVEASPEQPFISLTLEVPTELVVRTLLDLADVCPVAVAPSGPPQSAFLAELDDRVLEPLVRLVGCLDDPAERKVVAPLALHELVFRLLRSDAAAALRAAACRGGDEGRIAESMAFIRANAQRKLSVEQLAKRAAMSPSHFAHRFREVARVSPMRYLKHVRLEHASVLLQQRLRAGEVATRTGYASVAHFTRDFKQRFGVAPGQYARRIGAGETIAGSDNHVAASALAAGNASA
ncbi:MAG: AraC family transcriptional regulator [Deltaproteobacteria bacterium]|nr:AraC family transcriptional regulator [Nannocystaceae bacterium]